MATKGFTMAAEDERWTTMMTGDADYRTLPDARAFGMRIAAEFGTTAPNAAGDAVELVVGA